MDKKAAEVASFWKNLLKQEWIFIRSTGFRDDRIIINASGSRCSIVLILRKIGDGEYSDHISLGISADPLAKFDKNGIMPLVNTLVKLINEKSGVAENISCKYMQNCGGSERNPKKRSYFVTDWHINPEGHYKKLLKLRLRSREIGNLYPLYQHKNPETRE